jgi:Mg/Co/Ni transporter MgtE
MFVPKTNEAKALSKRNKKLAKGVKWLAEHTPKQPKLSTYYLKDVLENKVELLLANMSQRQKQTEFVKYLKHTDAEAIQPEIFVNEFNTQISRVIDELNDSTNRDVAFWPVPEFTVRINDDDTDVSGMVSSTDQ